MANDPQFPDPDTNPFAVGGAANPYAPTSATAVVDAAPSDVEAYRKQYLNHEASVKSIGTLYMLGAIFMVPIGFGMLVVSVINGGEDAIIMGVIGAFYGAVGLLQGFVALGLRGLAIWARTVAIIFSVLGLLAIPIGTLISAYFLYLLLCEKGNIVFSENYKRVIEQTPHIKYNTSIIVWIFLIFLLALIGLGMVGMLVGAAKG